MLAMESLEKEVAIEFNAAEVKVVFARRVEPPFQQAAMCVDQVSAAFIAVFFE